MLRYFYLLCLLVCIRITFCYEYIADRNSYNSRRVGKDSRHRKVKDSGRRYIKRHDYEVVEDKDPVAHIDVASFIDKADYDAVGDSPYMYPYKKREPVSKDYSEYGPITGLNMEGDKRTQDYLYQGANNVNEKPYMDKNMLSPRYSRFNSMSLYGMENKNEIHDDLSAKSYQKDFLMDKPHYHKAVKKCSLTKMKIPFFSHKKNGSTKVRKVKKRKYFFFFKSGNKTKEVNTTLPPVINPTWTMNKNSLKIYKRSNNKRICPVCRRKFPTETEDSIDRRRRTSSRIIHNSRQFYQPLRPLTKNKPKTDTPLEDVNYSVDEGNDIEERRKRDDDELEKERQLKELEEVRKKIDNVHTNANPKGNPHNTNQI